MSKLLIDESPLIVLPSLAIAIGLNEAIALQQLHYWLNKPGVGYYTEDGRKWVKNTYAQWRESNFPFWSEKTIQRTFNTLEGLGLVLSERPDAARYDRAKAYTIDYPAVNSLSVRKRQSVHIEPDNPSDSLNDSEITAEKEKRSTQSNPVQGKPAPDLLRDAGAEWLVAAGVDTEEIAAILKRERRETETCRLWEQAMGYSPLDWRKKGRPELLRFLLERPPEEVRAFAAWSKRPYSTFDPAKALSHPRQVIELWPTAMEWRQGRTPTRAPARPAPRFVEERE